MIKFDILNRWTDRVQFTAEIDCAESAPRRLKLGLALQWGYKSGADLRDADLSGADLRSVPVVLNIDASILAAVEAGGKLDMTTWHRCGTTHCRAGWAITLAGAAGAALEFAMGSAAAGALIYAASRPGKPIPDFYCDNTSAMADLKACAAEQAGDSNA